MCFGNFFCLDLVFELVRHTLIEMKPTKEGGDVDIDVDQEFLDQVLNNLYDFGDGADGKKSKKYKKWKKKSSVEEKDAADENDHSLNKNNGNDKTDLSDMTDASSDERVSATTSTEFKSEMLDRKASNVEVVTFQDPLKKNKLKRAVEPKPKPADVKDMEKKAQTEEITIKKARLDVHRFGITGFQKQQQVVIERDRAIMLGARPPKKEYINYKLYQQAIKEKNMKEKMEAPSEGQKRRKRSGKPPSLKRKSSTEPSGQVGHFNGGMLLLSSKDMQKLNGKLKKRRR